MPEQFTLLDTDTLITARSSGFGHVPNGSLADLVAIRYQIERGARYLGRDVDILVGSTSVVGACTAFGGAFRVSITVCLSKLGACPAY
jgi:hypothetical protein